ncbi:MAG TPA: 5'-nucleotidase C-terminal domain-containing protein [bacterium]|nr:5'-nucleotidase C-terminal domain-containing protein [bacterium]HOL48769.1 5'-nucleotidase C-terminal domain-containing protein [bacterium]HPQ19778.1 5'-nucleotidase C-terminal domain-containing protein [bacterium]
MSILLIFTICFFIGCGSTEKPSWQAPPATPSTPVSVKVFGEDTTSFKLVSGNVFTGSETYSIFCEETGYTPSCGDTPLVDYVITGGNICVYYSGGPGAGGAAVYSAGRRYPNIGIRTGEEPMMNLITDGMLYYARKHYSNYANPIRIAIHNGGGINKEKTISVDSFKSGGAVSFVKSLFRFDNYLTVVELTPASLKRLIEYGIAGMRYRDNSKTLSENANVSDGNFLHFSGISFTYTRGASSIEDNAYYYDATNNIITNNGSRVVDLYLWNIPSYDTVNDPYDSNLANALNHPEDSIPLVLNGQLVPEYADTKIYAIAVNFLMITEKAAAAAAEITEDKIKYVSSTIRPNEALEEILTDTEHYTLYHRLQGRIKAVMGGVSASNVSAEISLSHPTYIKTNDTFSITIIDPDLNTISSIKEFYLSAVSIANVSKNDIENIAIFENSENVKNFSGSILVDTNSSSNQVNNQKLFAEDGDTIVIAYQDPYYVNDKKFITRRVINGSIATISLKQDTNATSLGSILTDAYYINLTDTSWSGDTLQILLTDADQNQDITASETITVIITVIRSDTTTIFDTVVLELTENGINNSTFIGTVNMVDTTTFDSTNNTIEATKNYKIRIYYKDPDSIEELITEILVI